MGGWGGGGGSATLPPTPRRGVMAAGWPQAAASAGRAGRCTTLADMPPPPPPRPQPTWPGWASTTAPRWGEPLGPCGPGGGGGGPAGGLPPGSAGRGRLALPAQLATGGCLALAPAPTHPPTRPPRTPTHPPVHPPTHPRSWSKPELVQRANGFAAVMGLSQPPALLKKTVGMMASRGLLGLGGEGGEGAVHASRGGRRCPAANTSPPRQLPSKAGWRAPASTPTALKNKAYPPSNNPYPPPFVFHRA